MANSSSASEFDIDIGKYIQVIKRNWLPAAGVFSAVTVLATALAVLREPTYQTSGKVLVKPDLTPVLAGLDVPGRQSIGELEAIGLESDPIATEVETILSLEVAEKTIEALSLQTDAGEPLKAEDFFKAFGAQSIPGTDMIQISYMSPDPELAALVVNQAIDVYRDNNISLKRAEAIAAREFIANQLPSTETELRQAERELRQFKEENNIVSLPDESVGTVTAIQQLNDEIALSRAELAAATAQSQNLQQRLGMEPDDALTATALSQSNAIQETFTQIRDVQNQLDLARGDYRPTHPAVQSLERKEAELQQRLQSHVADAIGVETFPEQGLQMGLLQQDLTTNLLQAEVERAGLVNRINELRALQTAQRERASVFPRLEATQRELERELTVAQSTYETLLQRLQEVQVAQNKTIDNVRVVSRALVPEDPASSKKLTVAAGMMVGAVLGLIAAFAIDLLNRSVKTATEAQNLLELPILGVIPHLNDNAPFVIRPDDFDTKRNPHPYRLLQANLSFVSSQADHRIIVITSSVSGEGRTRTAANLALAVAQAGTKVLLVDADLNQPNQHNVWRCQNDVGLVQVLEDDAGLESAVSNVAPNLSVLTAGAGAQGSLAIANARRLERFMDQAARRFDLILIDASPLNQSADASSLGTLADGTLMVTRPKFARVEDVKAAKVLMSLSGQPVLGMVVNGVEQGTSLNQYFAAASNEFVLHDHSLIVDPDEPVSVGSNSHVRGDASRVDETLV